MYIIIGDEAAQKLKDNYVVLELEPIAREGQQVTAYCVVQGDQIPVMELPQLEHFKTLHASFVDEYKKGNYKFCQDAVEHLTGKFGGELDSYYAEVLSRIARSSQPQQS